MDDDIKLRPIEDRVIIDTSETAWQMSRLLIKDPALIEHAPFPFACGARAPWSTATVSPVALPVVTAGPSAALITLSLDYACLIALDYVK